MKKQLWMPPKKKYSNQGYAAPIPGYTNPLNAPPILPHFFSMLTGCATAIDRYNVLLIGGHYTLQIHTDHSTERVESFVNYNEPFTGPLYPPPFNYPVSPISDPTNDQVLHYNFQNRTWKLYENVPNVGVSFIKIVLGTNQKCFPYMYGCYLFIFLSKKEFNAVDVQYQCSTMIHKNLSRYVIYV